MYGTASSSLGTGAKNSAEGRIFCDGRRCSSIGAESTSVRINVWVSTFRFSYRSKKFGRRPNFLRRQEVQLYRSKYNIILYVSASPTSTSSAVCTNVCVNIFRFISVYASMSMGMYVSEHMSMYVYMSVSSALALCMHLIRRTCRCRWICPWECKCRHLPLQRPEQKREWNAWGNCALSKPVPTYTRSSCYSTVIYLYFFFTNFIFCIYMVAHQLLQF